MTVYAPRFTSKDPQVAEWWANQHVKSKSLEMAIKILIQRFGTMDIYEAAMMQLLENSGYRVVLNEPIASTVEPKKESVKEVSVEKPAPEEQVLDPQALIKASEEKPKVKAKETKTTADTMNAEDILAMMSNQASSM